MQASTVRRRRGWILTALATAVAFVVVSGLAYHVTDTRGANLVLTLFVLTVVIGGGLLWTGRGGEQS